MKWNEWIDYFQLSNLPNNIVLNPYFLLTLTYLTLSINLFFKLIHFKRFIYVFTSLLYVYQLLSLK